MIDDNWSSRGLRKGLGWVPDEPDERDYAIYNQIAEKYMEIDSRRSLRRVHTILKDVSGHLSFEAIKELESLKEDLEKFEFVRVSTYNLLYENLQDKQVVFCKFLMTYFYQQQLRIFPDEDIFNVMMGSIVDWITSSLKQVQEEGIKQVANEIEDKLKGHKILIPERIWKIHEDDLKDKDRALNEYKKIKNKYSSGDQKPENFKFLGFISDPSDYWSWLNSEEYDYVLTALFKGFQTWINKEVYNKSDDDKIYVDGIVGIQTYTWLKRKFLKTGLVDQEAPAQGSEETNKEIVFSRIPFPTAMPPVAIKAVLKMLYLGGIQGGKIDPTHRSFEGEYPVNDNLDAKIDRLGKENFFEIEPIIAVLVQITGPMGTYPKTLEKALELAVKVFSSFLRENPEREILPQDSQKILSLVLSGKQDLEDPIFHLGQTTQLPEKTFLELEEEFEKTAQLRRLSHQAVDTFLNRVGSYLRVLFRKDLMAFDQAIEELFDQDSDQDSEVKAKALQDEMERRCDSAVFLVSMAKVIWNLVEKDDSSLVEKINQFIQDLPEWLKKRQKVILEKIQNNNDSDINRIYPVSSNFELVSPGRETDNYFRELVALELSEDVLECGHHTGWCSPMNESYQSDADIWNSPQKSEISKWLFPSYLVPGGADLLKNRRAARKRVLYTRSTENLQVKTFTYLPKVVDLSFWCSPISDQGELQSCSAHAGAALVEYFARRYNNDDKLVSRRFLYKIARNLMGRHGDLGSSLRETIKAIALFGVPPEKYWHYDLEQFDEEPTPFCYSFAQNYQALNYFRLDHQNVANDELLLRIKIALAAGFPCVFGFTLHESVYDEFNFKRGYVPYPGKSVDNLSRPDPPIGGHALLTVGYHDLKTLMHSNNPRRRSKGAFLVRNSWGTSWGLNGYGWLPYDYVLQGLTSDWWSLIQLNWLESGKFGLGGARDTGAGSTRQPGT